MAQKHHNSGIIANDGTGDALRTFSQDVESNETELYNGKVDKVTGKALSENDFTQAYKDAIDNFIPSTQIQSDYTQADNLQKDFIKNKPDLSGYTTTAYVDAQITAIKGGADTTIDTLQKLNDKFEEKTPYNELILLISSPQIFTMPLGVFAKILHLNGAFLAPTYWAQSGQALTITYPDFSVNGLDEIWITN